MRLCGLHTKIRVKKCFFFAKNYIIPCNVFVVVVAVGAAAAAVTIFVHAYATYGVVKSELAL